VAIPERHSRRENEHLRLIAKQEAGCRFFVSQVVYDLNAAKNLVSDYRYECESRGLAPVPIVFTFSVCGSMKTLEFLRWLGVDVPRWIENDLRHSTNPLAASLEQAQATAVELIDFCRRLGVPFGLNVESVSIRREEIEASVDLAARLTSYHGPGPVQTRAESGTRVPLVRPSWAVLRIRYGQRHDVRRPAPPNQCTAPRRPTRTPLPCHQPVASSFWLAHVPLNPDGTTAAPDDYVQQARYVCTTWNKHLPRPMPTSPTSSAHVSWCIRRTQESRRGVECGE
jgi:hypothetical protein